MLLLFCDTGSNVDVTPMCRRLYSRLLEIDWNVLAPLQSRGQSRALRPPPRLVLCVLACFSLALMLVYSSTHVGGILQLGPMDREQMSSSLFDAPGDLIKTPTCRIPDFDPWDRLVMKKFFKQKPARCKAAPFFIRTRVHDTYTVPHLDKAILLRHYFLRPTSIRCSYEIAVRDEDSKMPDLKYKLINKTSLEFGKPIDAEYIWVECFRLARQKRFYVQPLLLARAKGENMSQNASSPPYKPYNVIVLGYDSVSRLNFHRSLPRTRAFLRRRSNTTVELLGYNKVGLNSGPNQVPLLSGQRFRPRGLYEQFRTHFVDNMARYIWDDFHDAGYSTMFFEEQWDYGLFVWPELKGFQKPPTDYWPRPIMQASDNSLLKRKLGHNVCLGSRPALATYLDYVLDLLRTSRRPLWMYPWFSELAHDKLDGAGTADDSFFDFLSTMEREGFLDTTVIFFISDHGFRFGALRDTPLGRFEDQLPFGFVLIPPSLADQRPDAMRKLRINAHRLVTTYDMHATMLELATNGVERSQRVSARTPAGLSLLSEVVPLNRTCAEARIDIEFCSCYGVRQDAIDASFAERLGQTIVDDINAQLEQNNDTKCMRWQVATVTQASQLVQGSQPLNMYRVAIATNPSGRFEAVIESDYSQQQQQQRRLKVISGVDRTDRFGEHAYCVMPSVYERLCYCK